MRSPSLGRELRAAIFAGAMIWLALAAAMLVAGAVDAFGGDGGWRDMVLSAGLVTTAAGLVAFSTRGATPPPTQRFGFLLVVTLWTMAPLAATVPFILHGMTPVDALFEATSGLTTTGATVMTGLDDENRAILMWRAIMQWLGGVGILALGLVLLPFLQIGGMQLFSKESSDRSSDKPLPRFAAFGRTLLGVYAFATVACAMAYSAVGLSGFDAVAHALTTVSTAGFSTYDASMGHFDSVGPLWVGSFFMLVGALPFAMYIAFLAGRRPFGIDPQVPLFFTIVAVSSLLVIVLRNDVITSRAVAEDVFNVISVITTTGYAASDYTAWGSTPVAIFFLLMFLGGCAGSTTGGVKTYRLLVTGAMLRTHLRRLVMPNAVSLTRYGAREVNPAVFRSALVFLIAFAVSLMALTVALAGTGLDFLTAHTAALTALTNVGPGLGPVIGPAGTFAPIPDAAKLLVTLGMILGRLEILPVLVLLLPEFWRR